MAIARVGRRLTPKSWPNGAKVAVNIGCDVDNMGIGRGGGPVAGLTVGRRVRYAFRGRRFDEDTNPRG